MDILAPAERSKRMALVRAKDTKPELVVRRLVHSLGYRYRLHAANLHGRPDMVFGLLKGVIFVHGCFWHRHPGCRNNRTPKSRLEYWLPKLRANRYRDRKVQRALAKDGWSSLVIWECELKNLGSVRQRVVAFLGSQRRKRMRGDAG